MVRRISVLKQTYQNLPLLVPAVFPAEKTFEFRESDWFLEIVDAYKEALQRYGVLNVNPVRDERIIAGLPFVRIPAGQFAMGLPAGASQSGELPHPAAVAELYMLKGEVTRAAFADFISQNPTWHPENIRELIERRLVDDLYLKSFFEAAPDDVPVSYVSYFAAQAFGTWFEKSLPEAWSSFTVRLPTEVEWEWAAKLHSTADEASGNFHSDGPSELLGRQGVEALMGSLWEWCDTWFQPAAYFLSSWTPAGTGKSPSIGAEVVVRGGSWANQIEDRIDPATRGSQSPQWCTPFTGFRIVMVRE